ncbi:unnamed protein product [Closterium sp. NIES-65]|nr:unnamed protein product [Closterium sp. NIES-65]
MHHMPLSLLSVTPMRPPSPKVTAVHSCTHKLALLHSSLSLHSTRLLLSSSLTTSVLPLHSPVFSTSSFLPRSVLICPLLSQQIAYMGVAVAGDTECTGSSCSPPNPPTAKYFLLVAYTGVAVVGDMECTGSSCSPPNPPTAKYPALPLFFQPSHSVAFRVLPSVPPKRPEPPFKLEPLFSPCRFRGGAWGSTPPLLRTPPLVAMQVAVVGAEGGSTPLGWDGMGENRDWVVWNKVEGRGVRVNTDASPRPSLVAVQVPWGWEGGSTATHWNWRQEGEFGDGLGLARYAASLLGSPLSPSPLHSLLQLSSVLSFSYLFLLVLARVFLFMSTHQFLRLLLSCPTSPFSARYQVDQHQGKNAHTSSRAAEQEGWEEGCRGRESPGGASPTLCSPPALTPSDKWRGGACGSTPTLPHAPPLWPMGGQQHCSTAPVSLLGATRGEYGDGLGLTRPVFQATDPPTPTTGNPSADSPLVPHSTLTVAVCVPCRWWGGVWGQHRHSSAPLPLWPCRLKVGSTGVRVEEWSPPSHSPPPLSFFPSLPAAPCLAYRGASPSPNFPFSLHFPAASASWRTARLR